MIYKCAKFLRIFSTVRCFALAEDTGEKIFIRTDVVYVKIHLEYFQYKKNESRTLFVGVYSINANTYLSFSARLRTDASCRTCVYKYKWVFARIVIILFFVFVEIVCVMYM